jgi:hypothetical protein
LLIDTDPYGPGQIRTEPCGLGAKAKGNHFCPIATFIDNSREMYVASQLLLYSSFISFLPQYEQNLPNGAVTVRVWRTSIAINDSLICLSLPSRISLLAILVATSSKSPFSANFHRSSCMQLEDIRKFERFRVSTVHPFGMQPGWIL